MKKYFTIGMAGHIDHGKTTLTKALTNVDTDRLKEEKERQISIELGFAPLFEDDHMHVSVVDVPGHERFIRQMIAGVAGIDLVVLVVAADEGVMPQTKEHLEILHFLGVRRGIVAISKADRVENDFLDLVREEILLELENSIFKNSPVVMVDSISRKGIDQLRATILNELAQLEPRDSTGPFRLPIDQVFTVKGQGTVVRGTVYEGRVNEDQTILVLPQNIEVRARQLQVHHSPAKTAFAGQRVAINLSGTAKEELERGNVLVSSKHFIVSNCMDVSLQMVGDLEHLVKQRMPIKCHIGTSEVMGRIVFFDRNEITEESGEILCQLRLEEEIVIKRGDRFILRRPSPQETIGGGWVIDPKGEKYRFGDKTIQELVKKREGKPDERVLAALQAAKGLTAADLLTRTSLSNEELVSVLQMESFICYYPEHYTHKSVITAVIEDIFDQLMVFHKKSPMRPGINKAEIVQSLQKSLPSQLIEYVLETGVEQGIWDRKGSIISKAEFQPHVPKSWSKRVEGMLEAIEKAGLSVEYLENYLAEAGIPSNIALELRYFLLNTKQIMALDEKFHLATSVFNKAVNKLKEHTGDTFEVGDAKEVLGLSRKYMIPFLELLDREKITVREDNRRRWVKKVL
ncbi:selenocysteine-specific translation elongation factor [Bacillus sp. M6-12]|uniref:selenocysteine-specific translation elongation factor n=1 Tax=Bacillus sp. M6-12 TaxID=2054166 RepID=UPI000C7614C9|nr:selenocysteine-specific translation elongation factor [Bacillus sp. M6-12]PLS16821.1 selenocysteine-specific translation elongation factor [Bacillus sp. M6-12]